MSNAIITQVIELMSDLPDNLQQEVLKFVLALHQEQVPVIDWQKEELATRKSAYMQNPNSGSSWEAAKVRIRNSQNEN